jgi:hypothetical protein
MKASKLWKRPSAARSSRDTPILHMFVPSSPGLKSYASTVILTIVGGVAHAQSVNVNFNAAADLSAFGQRTSGAVVNGSAPTTNTLVFGAAAGVNGSGGVTRTTAGAEVTATYLPTSFDLTSNAPFNISTFLKTGTIAAATSGNTLQIGFLPTDTLAFNGDSGNAFVRVRLLDVNTTDSTFQLQSQLKTTTGATSATSSAAFSLLNDEWYRLTGTIARSTTANNFDFSVSLEDWGTAGASFVSTVAGPFTGTMVNPDLTPRCTELSGTRAPAQWRPITSWSFRSRAHSSPCWPESVCSD